MPNPPRTAAIPRRPGNHGAAAAAAYLLLAVAFLYDVALTGGSYLLRDILTFFHPWQTAVAHAWRSGHVPLWNHDTYCGIPLAANLQSGVFYPPNWLYLLLPFDLALTAGMVLHLTVAATTMRGFLRRLELSESSAFLGGMLFGFGTWTLAYLEFPMKLGSAVWIPLLWSGLWDAMARGRQRGVAWGALAVAMSLLGGYPQLTFLGLLSALLLAVLLAGRVARDATLTAGARLHRWATLPALLVVALLVAGVQLLPAAEMAGLSSKAAPYEAGVAMSRSLPFKALLGLVDPFIFGFPGIGRYWGGETIEYCFGTFYVGALGLLLAGASAPAFRRFRRRRRISREDLAAPPDAPIVPREIAFFLLGGVLLGVVLSLGRHTPIYPLLHEWVPGFGRTRWPATATFLIALHLSALAAVGLHAMRREHRWIRRASWVAIALGVALLLIWLLARGPLEGAMRALLLAGSPAYQQAAWEAAHGDWLATIPVRAAIPLVAGILGLTLASIRWRVPVAWAALLVLDLFLAGRGLGMPTARGFYDAPTENAAALREQLDGRRLFTPRNVDQLGNFLYGSDNPLAFEWAKRGLLCNANIPAGIAQAQGCDPLNPRRHDAFAQIFEDPATPHAVRERIFDLWDAAFLLEVEGVRPLDLPGLTDPDVGRRLNPHEPSIGRATVLSGWRTYDDAKPLLDDLLAASHDPRSRALLEVPRGTPPPPEPDRRPRARGERVEYESGPNSLKVAWHVGNGGMLRVLESWAPGWRATVNGQPAPVYRADFLFLAVPVPEGSVIVELTYRPDSFQRGLIASGVGLLLLTTLFITSRRRTVPQEKEEAA